LRQLDNGFRTISAQALLHSGAGPDHHSLGSEPAGRPIAAGSVVQVPDAQFREPRAYASGIRTVFLTLAIVLAMLGPSACKQKTKVEAVAVAVLPPQSVVAMSDPAVAGQLKSGFYGIESGSWRWTARNFSVMLQPPVGSAQNGARLHFKFTLPDAVIDKLGPLQLSASVAGVALPPKRYVMAGSFDYQGDVPASALGGGPVTVEFSCDKALPPSGGEMRELALIAQSVGLELPGAESH
jgi:hypothetical protein